MLAIVRLRLKAWLLVALLAFVAQFGVTVSQVSPPRQRQAIVFVDRAESQEARLEPKSKPAAQNSSVALPRPAAPRPVGSQKPKLFQRPPPSLLLRA
jgi:hypothetical protein